MRYHINNEGEAKPCNAQAGQCPFMDDNEHFASEGEAMMYQEQVMLGSRANFLYDAQQRELQNINIVFKQTPLKELDASQLSQTLVNECSEVGMDETVIKSSVGLATILHSHQKRGNRGGHTTTPYIEHPLRNATRLVRFGVKDQDIIVAAILHDTIEDGAQKYVEKFQGHNEPELPARQTLSRHIEKTYGKEVTRLVESVTNDYLTDTDKSRMSVSAKNKIYYDHVKKNIAGDRGVYLVKLSDFIDNATGLYHNDIPGREAKTLKQARKYLPVVQVFKNEGEKLRLELPKRSVNEIIEKLNRTEARLSKIVKKHENHA